MMKFLGQTVIYRDKDQSVDRPFPNGETLTPAFIADFADLEGFATEILSDVMGGSDTDPTARGELLAKFGELVSNCKGFVDRRFLEKRDALKAFTGMEIDGNNELVRPPSKAQAEGKTGEDLRVAMGKEEEVYQYDK